MNWAWFGVLYLVLILAAVGLHALFFDSPEEYEWRKHMAAKDAWKKMMEDQ